MLLLIVQRWAENTVNGGEKTKKIYCDVKECNKEVGEGTGRWHYKIIITDVSMNRQLSCVDMCDTCGQLIKELVDIFIENNGTLPLKIIDQQHPSLYTRIIKEEKSSPLTTIQIEMIRKTYKEKPNLDTVLQIIDVYGFKQVRSILSKLSKTKL